LISSDDPVTNWPFRTVDLPSQRSIRTLPCCPYSPTNASFPPPKNGREVVDDLASYFAFFEEPLPITGAQARPDDPVWRE
jgi:hypothetical protein